MKGRQRSVLAFDIVYNLRGREYETKSVIPICRFFFCLLIDLFRNYDYTSVHVVGSKSIANIAAHPRNFEICSFSHLNASLDSKTEFIVPKGKGELAVKSLP